MDRVAIFIDGSNFYHALKSAFGKARIRFDALARALTDRVANRKLIRVYYYNAAVDQSSGDLYANQQKFFESLRRTPYLTMTLGRLERRPIDWSELDETARSALETAFDAKLPAYTHVEKGVDVQLAVDMVALAVADTYDVAVLISGDGDFAPAVELVKRLGKHVELARVQELPCYKLREACDIEVVIDEAILAGCWVS